MPFDFHRTLLTMTQQGASDLHLRARAPVCLRQNGVIERTALVSPTHEELEHLARRILAAEQLEVLRRVHQVQVVHQARELGARFRVAFFRQRSTLAVAARHIPSTIPSLADLGLADRIGEMLDKRRGLILLTGPSASGKTTTMAALLQHWNQRLPVHIVTLEDPVEYLLTPARALVNQRQVGLDTPSYAMGLRQVLRQNPDIISLGDILDLDTVSVAMAAADTGHLVVATLQTPGVAISVEHLIGLFPAPQQSQARAQLSLILQGIVGQVLVPTRDRSRRVAAFEVLNVAEAHRNLIRTNQTFRIQDTLDTTPGCTSLTRSLGALAGQGLIRDELLEQYRPR